MKEETENNNWRSTANNLRDEFERLIEQMLTFESRQKIIKDLDEAILKITDDADEVFQLVLSKSLMAVKDMQFAHILILEQKKLKVVATYKDDKTKGRIIENEGLVRKAIDKDQILNIADVKKEPDYLETNPTTCAALIVPIKDKSQKKVLGVLNIEKDKLGSFAQEDEEFCKILAGQLALAIEQTKLWASIQLISRFSSNLLSGENRTQRNYTDLLKDLLSILDIEYGQIIEYKKKSNKFVIHADNLRPENINGVLDINKSITGFYIINESGKKLLEITNLPENNLYKDYYGGQGLSTIGHLPGSMLIAPLLSGDDIVGSFNLESNYIHGFSDLDKRIVSIICDLLADAIRSGITRRSIKQKTDAEREIYIMTQMGLIAIDYSHRSGNKVSGISGDLRTIIDSIEEERVNLPMVGKKDGLEYLKTVLSDALNLQDIIKEFQADFDPEKIESSPTPISIINYVNNTVEKVKHKNPNIKIEFTVEEFRDSDLICELSSTFKDVIESLLNNSVESFASIIDDREKTIQVTIGYQEDSSNAKITIKDNGCGIKQELIDSNKIFKYKFTTKKGYRGQGIGMWHIKTYTNLFNGSINISSQENSGTEVEISFPVQ
jgi:putative methionine-R-sulfoxide reductase with GAF domain